MLYLYCQKRNGFCGAPHRGQVAHGHIQGLNWVEGDLQSAADQSLLQQAPWHFGQPTDGHLEDAVLPLAWDGYFKIHLEKKTTEHKRGGKEPKRSKTTWTWMDQQRHIFKMRFHIADAASLQLQPRYRPMNLHVFHIIALWALWYDWQHRSLNPREIISNYFLLSLPRADVGTENKYKSTVKEL